MTSSASALPPDPAARAAWSLGRLTQPEDRIAVAVSGGSDSTALLLLALDWAVAAKRKLVAVTVDHGLRPEAAAEAERVAQLCARHGVAHETLRWRPPGEASVADARRARHALLAQWAQQAGAASVALGHTADDRIETFLMRARSGSDWWGLAGPMPSAPSPVWPDGHSVRLIRPLLWAGREELRRWLRVRGEPWIEDPTNENPKHERARMRRLAGALSLPVRERLIASLDRLALLRSARLAAVRALAREAGGLIDFDAADLDMGVWRRAPAQVREHLLGYLILSVAGRDAPLRADRLRVLAGRLAEGPITATLGGARLQETKGWLRLRRAPPRRTDPPWPQRPLNAGAAARMTGLLANPHVETLSPVPTGTETA